MDQGAILYQRYLEGDDSAFSDLLNEYRDSLIFFLNRTLDNLSVAEEIAAEAFAELIIHKGRYKGKVAFKTYLYSIGHHKMVDYIRKEARHPKVTYEDATEKSLSYASFEQDVVKDAQNQLLYQGMAGLPEDYRVALYLFYFENMSYEEAAVVMKKNKKQIANLVFRAKAALKKALEQEGFEYED